MDLREKATWMTGILVFWGIALLFLIIDNLTQLHRLDSAFGWGVLLGTLVYIVSLLFRVTFLAGRRYR